MIKSRHVPLFCHSEVTLLRPQCCLFDRDHDLQNSTEILWPVSLTLHDRGITYATEGIIADHCQITPSTTTMIYRPRMEMKNGVANLVLSLESATLESFVAKLVYIIIGAKTTASTTVTAYLPFASI